MVVKLEPWEVEVCDEIANRRNAPKLSNGNWGKDSAEAHREGVRSEYAVAKFLGLDINTAMYGTQGDGGFGDLNMPYSTTAQVKYRPKEGYDYALNTNNPGDFKDHIGILVYPGPDENSLRIAGWITREQFQERYHLTNYGFGQRAVVGREDLNDITKLRHRINALKAQETLKAWACEHMPPK